MVGMLKTLSDIWSWARSHWLTSSVLALFFFIGFQFVQAIVGAIMTPLNNWALQVFGSVLPTVGVAAGRDPLAAIATLILGLFLVGLGRRHAPPTSESARHEWMRIRDAVDYVHHHSVWTTSAMGTDWAVELDRSLRERFGRFFGRVRNQRKTLPSGRNAHELQRRRKYRQNLLGDGTL